MKNKSNRKFIALIILLAVVVIPVYCTCQLAELGSLLSPFEDATPTPDSRIAQAAATQPAPVTPTPIPSPTATPSPTPTPVPPTPTPKPKPTPKPTATLPYVRATPGSDGLWEGDAGQTEETNQFKEDGLWLIMWKCFDTNGSIIFTVNDSNHDVLDVYGSYPCSTSPQTITVYYTGTLSIGVASLGMDDGYVFGKA